MTDDHLKIYVNATRPATLNDGVGLVAPNVVAKTRGCHPARDFLLCADRRSRREDKLLPVSCLPLVPGMRGGRYGQSAPKSIGFTEPDGVGNETGYSIHLPSA
jgi:hypothetical protein